MFNYVVYNGSHFVPRTVHISATIIHSVYMYHQFA